MASTTLNAHIRATDEIVVTHRIHNAGGPVTLCITIEAGSHETGWTAINLFVQGDLITKKPALKNARALTEGVSQAVTEFVQEFPGLRGDLAPR